MNKNDLIGQISDNANLSKNESKILVDAIFDSITERLIEGEKVKLSGFGTFSVKTRRERLGRNPRTGAITRIPSRRAISFIAGKDLKRTVYESKTE